MSRPGFVFDLTTDKAAKTQESRCRTCGLTERAAAVPSATLHARLKTHLRESHALHASEEWKVTQQDRNETEAMVCFWPPEAL